MPQLHDPGLQLRFIGGQLPRAQRIFCRRCRALCMHRQRQGFDGVTRRQQLRNVALCIQNAFALHLGRVSGEYGRHKTVGQHISYSFWSYSRPPQAGQSHFDTAFLGVTSALVHRAATNVVAVFRQIGQVAEVRKRAHHTDCLVARQAFEQLFQRFVGFNIGVAPESD